MISRNVILTTAIFLFWSVLANAQWTMARIDQNGDVIGGPVTLSGFGCNGVCKVSDTGYVYYVTGEYAGDPYVYDSSLNFVNSVSSYCMNLSIDNTRAEIVNGHTVARFNLFLNQTDYFEVEGDLNYLAVDQADGAVWYSTVDPSGLHKMAHNGTIIYSNVSDYSGALSDVSPSGSFWVNKVQSWFVNPRLYDSDGTYRAQANISTRDVLEMYFATEACWMITEPRGVAKANSSGAIVYENYADFNQPHDLDVDQSDGSVWIADTNNFEVVHLDSDGGELLRKANNWTPHVVAVDPSDSTVIVIYEVGEVNVESASLGQIKAVFK